MRILITNFELGARSGTTMYVRDLAMHLRSHGHDPVVYTKFAGEVARELLQAGIVVTRNLSRIREAPEVIHGHHSIPTRDALRRFPDVPAIYVCHDHGNSLDRAVIHPQVRRYFGVSDLCIERLIRDGIAPEDIGWLGNFVDTRRFVARDRLPAVARRALVFSNYADKSSHLPAVSAACREAGLQLDVIGLAAGNPVAHPEAALHDYHIVFGKAKAAMEAIATGAAVVLCDFGGVGPMVTSANFAELRPMNFGFQALTDPLTPQQVLRRIRSYDAYEAALVCNTLRNSASLEAATGQLCQIYGEVIAAQAVSATWAREPRVPGLPRGARSAISGALRLWWLRVPPLKRSALKRVTGAGAVLSKLRSRRNAAAPRGRISVK